MTTGSFTQVEEDKTPPIMARDYKDPPVVCYSLDRAAFNQGQNAQYDMGIDDSGVVGTLGDKGPSAVCYGICSKDSNSMKSDNPHSGFYIADTSRTLDNNGGNPSCNQGGVAIVQAYAIQGSMIGREDKNGPQGDGVNEDVCFTLNTADRHGVVYGVPLNFRPENTKLYEESSTTLCNGTNPGFHQGVIEYSPVTLIVRRLTPTECARLQGMPDWWTDDLGISEPTEEEIDLWMERFETWRQTSDPDKKPKTRKQVEKWLKNPNSDSAEYKMWGNGMALPCIMFVMQETVKELRRRRLEAILQ